MSLYTVAKYLVEATEDRLLDAKDVPWRILSRIRKEFWHPLVYVRLGMDFLLQNLAKTVFYMGLFMGVAAYLSTRIGLSPQQVNANVVVATMGGLFVILFALPSTFAHFDIKDSDLQFIVEHIRCQLESKEELDVLRSNLEAMEECAADRVRTLRWTMATLWGALLFGYGQSMGFLTKLAEKNQIGELISGSVLFFVMAGFFTLIPLVAIAGYRRANNMVFRGLQFACNEVVLVIGTSPDSENAS